MKNDDLEQLKKKYRTTNEEWVADVVAFLQTQVPPSENLPPPSLPSLDSPKGASPMGLPPLDSTGKN